MKQLVAVYLALSVWAGFAIGGPLDDARTAYDRKDYSAAFAAYKALAIKGNADAQYTLGNMYDKGIGLPQDAQLAVYWYRKAADQGDMGAQFLLGGMYYYGRGVPRDFQRAVHWVRKAADQGLADAQSVLGVMYEEGTGVPKSDQQALIWYRKAADQGNALAQNNLGACYENGTGVSKNDPQAVFWYRKAAEQGHSAAQANLGRMYGDGKGVPKNDQQALLWYLKAAGQGESSAQYNIGRMFGHGLGVSKDPQVAYFWWLLASASGDENATRERDRIERTLLPAQRAAAQASAKNWKPDSKPAPTASKPFSPGSDDAGPTYYGPAASSQVVDPERRDTTGYLPEALRSASGGLSTFTVDNANGGEDAIARLYLDGKKPAVRSFYVKHGEKFTATSMAPGNYILRYRMIGTEDTFEANQTFVLAETDVPGGRSYSNLTVTLYKVSNGNLETRKVAKENF